MSNITIHQLEPDLTHRLEQRAAEHGHTIEAEIKAILYSVLTPETSSQIVGVASPMENLATAIERRFANLGEFDIPETPRDPMRTPPSFEATAG